MTTRKGRVHSLDELLPRDPDTPDPAPPPDPAVPTVRPDLDQSRRDLEERQRRWLEERDRFERRVRRKDPDPSETAPPAGSAGG